MLSRLLSLSVLAFAVFYEHSAIAQTRIATTPPIQLIEAPLDRKRNEQPIQLDNLSISSEVVGGLAQTTVGVFSSAYKAMAASTVSCTMILVTTLFAGSKTCSTAYSLCSSSRLPFFMSTAPSRKRVLLLRHQFN